MAELIYLSRQWQVSDDPLAYSTWMASSECDQKFLSHFAKTTGAENAYLSKFLYRLVGLSVLLASKLVRARKTRRIDPARDPKTVQLLHHILWLSREGLIMVEQYILPMVENYVELRILSYKLRASFYHIFVLFHNNPPVNKAIVSSNLVPDPLLPRLSKNGQSFNSALRSPQRGQAGASAYIIGGPVGSAPPPPGLAPLAPKSAISAEFLLPYIDYIPTATSCFAAANNLAERLLPGSHPIRLSIKVEYVAYLYDCLHAKEESRRLAKRSIADVYNATEGMDDESFEDAADMVSILGKMMKRGLGTGSGSGSGTASQGRSGASRSTPRVQEQQQQQQQRRRQQTPPATWV